jgi:hypothetical protein
VATEKTKKQLEEENRRLIFELRMVRKSKSTEQIASVLNNLIKWGGIVAIFYFLSQGIDSLAGKNTISNIAISLFADLKINQYLSYAIGFGGTGYGLVQRNLRRSTIKRLQGNIVSMEKAIDPDRSSSNLTLEGCTRSEDL